MHGIAGKQLPGKVYFEKGLFGLGWVPNGHTVVQEALGVPYSFKTISAGVPANGLALIVVFWDSTQSPDLLVEIGLIVLN